MPYLKAHEKDKLSHVASQIAMAELKEAGQLNYLFTMIARRYISLNGESYQRYNDIVGALECAQFELYRRKVGPYENNKIQTNGDVF